MLHALSWDHMFISLKPVRAEQQSHSGSAVAAFAILRLGCYASFQPACISKLLQKVLASILFLAVGQHAVPRCCHACTCGFPVLSCHYLL